MADHPAPVSQGPADSSKVAVPLAAGTSSTLEVSAPMLEVHAPQHAVHTWKDFLVHIAAIAGSKHSNDVYLSENRGDLLVAAQN